MDDKIRQGDLYAFYGELLNDHQRRIYEDYVLNDLSLGEIAENEGISRQGVYDIVRRCTKQMDDLEEKLGLLGRFQKIRQSMIRMTALVDGSGISSEEKERFHSLSDEIMNEL